MSGRRRPRHCMVVHAYYPVGETRVQREALALIDRGYEVHVVCLRDEAEPGKETFEDVRIHRLPVARHRGAGLLGQLLEYLTFFVLAFVKLTVLHARHRFRTIQVHNLPDFLVFCALVPKFSGTPVILDLHDLMPELFAARAGVGMHHWLVRAVAWQERVSCRFADHVITVTDGWRETLIQRGVPPHDVSVVMNVADSRLFRPGSPVTAARNGEGFHLIYHGTFTHRYGVDLIIHAVDRVREDIPGIRLTLLGAGETREALIKLTRSRELEEQVRFSEDMVEADRLPSAIRSADVGIVPNRSNVFTDGILPTKLMEYVAMGVPVIAARTPTVAAYFDDSMIEFFEPGDPDDLAAHIRFLYQDTGRFEELCRNSAEFNRRYNWDSIAGRYCDLVDQLGTDRGGRESVT
jgi:glycosyltransferase involved in cell wall biosynthesis